MELFSYRREKTDQWISEFPGVSKIIFGKQQLLGKETHKPPPSIHHDDLLENKSKNELLKLYELDKSLSNIINFNIKQLNDPKSIIPVGLTIKLLTMKGDSHSNPNDIRTRIKKVIVNLDGIVRYKTFDVNDEQWYITLWNCTFNAKATIMELDFCFKKERNTYP